MVWLHGLQQDIHTRIIAYLDDGSLINLSQVTRSKTAPPSSLGLESAALHVMRQVPGVHQVLVSSSSSAVPSSPGPSDASHDSSSDSDTDMSSPEPDWEFTMTPDVQARLKALPDFKSHASLPGLPTELQLQIFGSLDQIDAACLGLTNSRSYSIYRALHGIKMPLNTRRSGPNPLEHAWELIGKTTCVHCGVYRCQLFEHIKSWMPENLEYCQMTLKFGSRANAGARDHCYRGKPSKPNRCGRHPIRSTTRHQDDPVIIDSFQQMYSQSTF